MATKKGKGQRDALKAKCFKFGKIGHFKHDCWQKEKEDSAGKKGRKVKAKKQKEVGTKGRNRKKGMKMRNSYLLPC